MERMEKRKEKVDLEGLLNSLIEKGWKPFGDNAIKIDYDGMKTRYGYGAITYKYRGSYIDDYGDEVEYEEWRHQFNNRELVSKESGLWQFCTENGMIKEEHKHERILDPTFGEGWADCKRQEHDGNYGYRLIESALCDEDKLEEFLLNNIKVDVESK